MRIDIKKLTIVTYISAAILAALIIYSMMTRPTPPSNFTLETVPTVCGYYSKSYIDKEIKMTNDMFSKVNKIIEESQPVEELAPFIYQMNYTYWEAYKYLKEGDLPKAQYYLLSTMQSADYVISYDEVDSWSTDKALSMVRITYKDYKGKFNELLSEIKEEEKNMSLEDSLGWLGTVEEKAAKIWFSLNQTEEFLSEVNKQKDVQAVPAWRYRMIQALSSMPAIYYYEACDILKNAKKKGGTFEPDELIDRLSKQILDEIEKLKKVPESSVIHNEVTEKKLNSWKEEVKALKRLSDMGLRSYALRKMIQDLALLRTYEALSNVSSKSPKVDEILKFRDQVYRELISRESVNRSWAYEMAAEHLNLAQYMLLFYFKGAIHESWDKLSRAVYTCLYIAKVYPDEVDEVLSEVLSS